MADYTVGIKVQMDTSSVEKGTEKTKEKFQETEKAASTFGDTLKAILTSKIISSGINAVVDGLKKIGTAAVNLVEDVIASYGEYEQLAGGVEKLFGNSADTVKEYADEAYKNAQMSANEYLETVTGFSAALISSLGGDTEKAAEMANMAVQDMADNANVFGSTMEEVSGVYESLAKGNYQVLDSLKLGYKGSKEGMQELIDHANQLKEANGQMGDLTVDSYADIVEAIHLVQDEMNITGTTQQEASKTVQGSIGSMKAAWKNFVTGLGDDNADIAELAENVISSATDVLDNVMPIIDNIVDAIPTAIESIAQAIEDNNLLDKVLNTATRIFNKLFDKMPALITQLGTVISNNLPEIENTITDILPEIITSLFDAIVTIVDSTDLGDLVTSVFDMINNIIQSIIPRIPELLGSLVTGIIEAIPDLFLGVGSTIVTTLDTIFTGYDKFDALNDKLAEHEEYWDKVITKYEEAKDQINNDAQTWRDHWDTLQSIVDETGQVQEGYEGLAEFLINDLKSATDVEIEYNNGKIENYQDLMSTMDDYMAKKQAELLLAAEEEKANEAYKLQAEIEENLSEAKINHANAIEELAAAQKALDDEKPGSIYLETLQNAYDEAASAEAYYAEEEQKYTEQYRENWETRMQYEEHYAAFSQGKYDEILDNQKQYTGNSKEDLEKYISDLEHQYAIYETNLELAHERAESTNSEAARKEEELWGKRVIDTKGTIDKLVKLAENGGSDFSSGYVNSILDGEEPAKDAAEKVTNSAIDSMQMTQQSQSPSKVTAGLGNDFSQGYINGIEELLSSVKSTASNIANGAANSLNNYNGAYNSGKNTGNGFWSGLNAIAGSISDKAYNIASNVYNGLNSQKGNAWDSGYNTGAGFLNGLSYISNSIINKAWGIAQSVGSAIASALNIHSPSKLTEELGEYTGEGFEIGLVKSFKSVLKTVGEYMTDIGDTIGADLGLTMTPPEISYDQSSGQGIYNADNIGSMTGLGNKAITTTTIGDINVYAQPGQDEEQIAQSVADIILGNAAREEVVFA